MDVTDSYFWIRRELHFVKIKWQGSKISGLDIQYLFQSVYKATKQIYRRFLGGILIKSQ